MRILYHHRTLGDGAEAIHISEMVVAFKCLRHEVEVVGLTRPNVTDTKWARNNSATRNLLKRVKSTFKGPFYEILEIGYNVLGYIMLMRKAKHFHPDLIYDRYMLYNYSSIAVGKKLNIPVFIEVNAPLAYERLHARDERLYFRRVAFLFERTICAKADKTIVVSTPLKNYLSSVGIPKDRILVLPNGVNTAKFYPREKSAVLLRNLKLDPQKPIIGFVGILRPWHGIDLLIEAFQMIRERRTEAQLLLVGDGPIRSDVERRVRDRGIENFVRITGRVKYEDVPKFVALFDVAVSPKATFYASPMKIIEYMAQGKAVVAPDMLNIKDLIRDEKDGILFTPNSAPSLAEKIIALLKNDYLRRTIGEEAHRRVMSEKDWRVNAQKIIDTYHSSVVRSRNL